MGNHPLWQTARVVYQMKNRPYFIGGLALGWGYLRSILYRRDVPLSKEIVKFARQEQMRRLTKFFDAVRLPNPNSWFVRPLRAATGRTAAGRCGTVPQE